MLGRMVVVPRILGIVAPDQTQFVGLVVEFARTELGLLVLVGVLSNAICGARLTYIYIYIFFG